MIIFGKTMEIVTKTWQGKKQKSIVSLSDGNETSDVTVVRSNWNMRGFAHVMISVDYLLISCLSRKHMISSKCPRHIIAIVPTIIELSLKMAIKIPGSSRFLAIMTS